MVLDEAHESPESRERGIWGENSGLGRHYIAVFYNFIASENYQTWAEHVYNLSCLVDGRVGFVNGQACLSVRWSFLSEL